MIAYPIFAFLSARAEQPQRFCMSQTIICLILIYRVVVRTRSSGTRETNSGGKLQARPRVANLYCCQGSRGRKSVRGFCLWLPKLLEKYFSFSTVFEMKASLQTGLPAIKFGLTIKSRLSKIDDMNHKSSYRGKGNGRKIKVEVHVRWLLKQG